jgi:hypothetical protein
MPDEFESINSRMPDLAAALTQRIASKKAEEAGTTLPPAGTVDPYQLMMNKKSGVEPKVENLPTWKKEEVQTLEDYCKKVGIVGFSSGRMPPLVALAMLKRQYGDFADVPLKERVPQGYEKIGTTNEYGANYPYSAAIQNKKILHG